MRGTAIESLCWQTLSSASAHKVLWLSLLFFSPHLDLQKLCKSEEFYGACNKSLEDEMGEEDLCEAEKSMKSPKEILNVRHEIPRRLIFQALFMLLFACKLMLIATKTAGVLIFQFIMIFRSHNWTHNEAPFAILLLVMWSSASGPGTIFHRQSITSVGVIYSSHLDADSIQAPMKRARGVASWNVPFRSFSVESAWIDSSLKTFASEPIQFQSQSNFLNC